MTISSADRERWLAERRKYLCASEASVALRESSYMTREDLILEKAGLQPAWAGSEQTDLGLDLEPAIAKAATRKWGWQLEACGALIADPLCASLAATPDYFVETPWGRGVVQIKLTTCQPTEDCKPRKNGEPSTARYANGAPLDYQLQVQAELAVTGLEWGALLVLHTCAPHFKLRAYSVRRHEGAIARIRAEADAFMREVHQLRANSTRQEQLRAFVAHENERNA